MTESFWFLSAEDDAERPEDSGVPFESRDGYTPFQESMRGDRSRPQRAPSTDQKRMRRQIHRSGTRHVAYDPLEEVDWNDYHPHLKDMAENGELHRGIGVNLPDDLHRFVHDDSKPVHERAQALLNHVAGMRNDPADRRVGLGMHWSLTGGVAEDFGERAAGHYAGANAREQDQHDFSWGRTPGEEPDYEDIERHLHEDHGIHPHDQPDHEHLNGLHTHLHKGVAPMEGQTELFDASRYADPGRVRHLTESEPYGEPDYAHGKPGTSVVLRTQIPDIDDIETHIHGNPYAGGDVYHPEGHGEMEVPIRHGASIPITGISWKPVYESDQEPDEEPDYTHHRFDGSEHREAMKKDPAYGEGSQQPVIPTHKLPSIPEEQARPRNYLHDLFEQSGIKPYLQPGGFDEPFQKERFEHRQRAREHRQQRNEIPQEEKTPEGRAADLLGDLIGEVGTEREVRDARPPGETRDEGKMRWFRDRWNKTFEPVGLNEEGKARSRRNTRARWEKTMGPAACDHPDCPPWEHHEGPYRPKYSAKIATVLNTQIERLNKGDQIRTPTGQTSEVKRLRPHETDSTLMYLDTDMGTSTVKRGTEFQVVPRNSQQQELPDTGNPMGGGNAAELPGAGKTPGGAGTTPNVAPGSCPNCGNTGTLHLHSGSYVCSVCGFTVPAGNSPGGLTFTNQPHGYMPTRRKPGEIPTAHVWASKYQTSNDSSSQIARRARQVSGGDQ